MDPGPPPTRPADPTGRRDFLRTAAIVGLTAIHGTGAAQAAPPAPALPGTAPLSEPPPVVYLSLGPGEAQFVEKLVNVMCPADEFTPDGMTCGLAVFIDRQLASAFGRGERLYLRGPWRAGVPEDGYQLPHTPEEYFKAGLRAVDAHCRSVYGRAFGQLDDAQADAVLQDVARGAVATPQLETARWFNELVYPLFEQACFSDPVYGGNRDKVFWKMIGYPGLPAVNGLNMVKYRGKPFPGAKAPKSMEDFA
jgi:gluconate 2-dehydrogenase gamma chain